MIASLWKFRKLIGVGLVVLAVACALFALYQHGYHAGIAYQQTLEVRALAQAQAHADQLAAVQHAHDVAAADALQTQLSALSARYSAFKPQIITRVLVRPGAAAACPKPFTPAFVELWNAH